jgi:hypothetical protein
VRNCSGLLAALLAAAPALAQEEERRAALLAEPKYAEDVVSPSFETRTPDGLRASLVGYLPEGNKVAVIADPQIGQNADETFSAFPGYEHTGAPARAGRSPRSPSRWAPDPRSTAATLPNGPGSRLRR